MLFGHMGCGFSDGYLASLEGDNVLSLKNLSQKTVLLMSLVKASRTSELQALDLRFRVFKPEGVISGFLL